MTDSPGPAADTCYRHPDRQSFVLCQRCGRTICPQCQTQAAVGVHCPECVREGRASVPRQKPAVLRAFRRGSTQPVVTYSIMGLTILIYALQRIPNSPVTGALLFNGLATTSEPWRMITAVFVHSPTSLLHIGFNMLSLFIFGPILEQALGRARFLTLYLLSGFGGSVAVLLIVPTTSVLGASGAIFGLLGAFFVIQRGLGGNSSGLLILIGINLVIGFIPGSRVSWEAHVGGLVTGVVIALIFMRTRNRPETWLPAAGVGAVAGALVLITVAAVFAFGLA